MKIYSFLFLLLSSTLFSQQVETFLAGPSTFNDGLAIDKYGNLYASQYYGSTVTKITPEGEASIFVSGLDSPNGLTIGPDGYLYVPNVGTDQIFKVDSLGNKEVFASVPKPSVLYFINDSTMYAGSYTTSAIYIVNSHGEAELWHSGSPLNGPIGIIQYEGGLYVGNFTDGKVFSVDTAKNFTTIADLPGWLGFMTRVGDNLYATCYNKNTIYKIPMDGSGETVFAGTGGRGNTDGNLLEATFNTPNGIVTSLTHDTLFISQYNTRSLRMITGMLTPTRVEESENISPDGFMLNQNYPNPFNPSTKISFSLPSDSEITLNVFDVNGKLVETVYRGMLQKGMHSFNYIASGISSGVYFYQLLTPYNKATGKMLLLK